jgi:DNA-binding response OmpR family regulator
MKGRILVVDDEQAMRASLADILRLEGYQVEALGSGEEAIEYLRRDDFDVIILDLKMPGLNGVEIMRMAGEVSPESEIIFLTAHGSLESAIEALHHAVHDYLLKPTSPHEILASVSRGISRRQEKQRRRWIFNQLDASLQELKTSERIFTTESSCRQTIALKNGVVIDLPRREVWQGNQRVVLTPTEGKLMQVLLENMERVLTHRDLVFMVQGYQTSDWEAPEILRPLVSRLRRKLAAFPGGEFWIMNVRGTGYVFDIDGGDRGVEDMIENG